MGAVAEGEDPLRAPVDAQLVRVGAELVVVAVRGRVEQQHPAPFRDPYDLGAGPSPRGGAGQPLDRAREPQQLLDGVRDAGEVGRQGRPLVAVTGQQVERATEEAGGGVVPAGHHREREPEDLQDLDVVARAHQLGDGVLAGIRPAPGGQAR